MGQADDHRPAVLFRAIAPPRAVARLDYEGAVWKLTGSSNVANDVSNPPEAILHSKARSPASEVLSLGLSLAMACAIFLP